MDLKDGPLGFPDQILTPMVQRKEQVIFLKIAPGEVI
jgi:hypothetical protein